MKKYYLFLIFILIMPSALADITITTDQPIYNFGNKIKASASALQDKDFEGLFKLAISCGIYNLQYFTTPVTLEANSRTALNVPDLTASQQMLGNCTMTGQLTTNDNSLIEQKTSSGFEVTNQLNVLPINTKITSMPSDSILITGVVNEAFGTNVLKAVTRIVLDNSTYTTDAVDGKFSETVSLPKNIKSGKHTITVSASDSRNNIGESFLKLEITAIPSYIKTELSGYQILPGTRMNITSSLFDQANDLINTSLDLELTSPKKSKVFTKIVQSNERIDYEFSQYVDPGTYVLTSTYNNLVTQSFINVSTVREAKIRYENESVFIENVGNIPFVDELTFFLQNDLRKYEITKKISLGPGKLLSIDLSKEVPSGIYDIMLPFKEGLAPIKEKINETISGLLGDKNILAEEAQIHDNRPVYKKIATGFDSVTAGLVGADGLLTKNPVVAPLILVVIVLLLVLKYGRKPIIKLIKGKKSEDKEK